MLELRDVTLCCIDTANHALALRALERSSAGIRFARVLMLTDRPISTPGWDVHLIPPLTSREDYSCLVLKSLLPHVETRHVLLVQWDGYVINPSAWRDDYLECDYLGAKWFWEPEGLRVGNGGFSLRSRRLLEALQDRRIELSGAEDETICKTFRPMLQQEYDIHFGSEALADLFSFEAAYPIGRPFGFHGLYNFCRVVPADELVELVGHFSSAIARSPQLLQLGRNCMALAQWRPAAAIFGRILDADPLHTEAAAAYAAASANAAAPVNVARNEPCPCGSGKRFKHCHGAAGASAASPAPLSTSDRLQQALSAHQQGNVVVAETIYRDVLATEPAHPLAQHFLGVIHYQRSEIEAALPLLQGSASAVPHEPEFHNNLGLALAAADREADAIAEYRAALLLKADHAVAWNNLGLALRSINDVAGAIDACRRAIALNPDFAHAHWNLSLSLLVDGQLNEGWREYEWRLALPELGKHRHSHSGSRWDGSSSHGKTLLLYPEQGLGDALQFIRYVSLLAQSGARCVIHCSHDLAELLSSVSGVRDVITGDAPLPVYDAHVSLLSLPHLLQTTLPTIPASVPYVSVPEPMIANARALLSTSGQRPRVGLAWAGNRAHANDRNRSIRLAALAPLFAVDDIAWFSLQSADAAAEIVTTPGVERMVALPPKNSLLETAALISALDLVITVDTSIAHLTGALARPVWVLLPFSPDWRWLLGRCDSPWYPTARLFRQPRLREWASVVERVGIELVAYRDAN